MAKSKSTLHETKARKAKVKIAAEAKQKAKDTAVLTTLKPIAKEINVRLEKASKADGLAVDHRVAAALRLAEAKAMCEKHKITFKKWIEANVDKSYSEVRLLAKAGAESDPATAVALIRSSNAERNKVFREKKKVLSRDNTSTKSPDASPFQRAVDSIAALGDQAALNLASDIAVSKGMAVISKHDHAELSDLRTARKDDKKLSLDRVKHDFDGLPASEKMDLVRYAAKKVGVEIVEPSFDLVKDQPAFLDRSHEVPGLSPKKKKAAKVIKRGAVA